MTLGQFTEPKLLIPMLRGITQVRVIAELVVRLLDDRITDGKEFYEAVRRREWSSGPISARGISFSFARSPGVRRLSIAAGLSAVGIPWAQKSAVVIPWARNTEDKVHAIFLGAIPLDREQSCTAIEAAIMSLATAETAYQALISCQQPEEMHSLLHSVRITPGAYSNQRPIGAIPSEGNVPYRK